MTDLTAPAADGGRRKPRIALMGEFSAGKSTLANLLMEQAKSPVRVTATQLPPIWYSLGDAPPVRIDAEGNETPLDGDDLTGISPDDTRAVRVFLQADVLRLCDIIDMPGSSDPNIAAEVWQGMLPLADAVIWCTPATQAWRQTEAAIWEDMPPELHERSALLVTRFDKVRTPEDGKRLLARVEREVDGLFRHVQAASLTDALAAREDEEAWRASGMDSFCETFVAMLEDLEARLDEATGAAARPEDGTAPGLARPFPQDAQDGLAVVGSDRHPPRRTAQTDGGQDAGEMQESGVMPRRVVRKTSSRTPRPSRPAQTESLI
jgi:hypothetical protein